jgi:hypothetical protein
VLQLNLAVNQANYPLVRAAEVGVREALAVVHLAVAAGEEVNVKPKNRFFVKIFKKIIEITVENQ